MSFNPGADTHTAERDQQRIAVATGVSNTDPTQTLSVMIDSVTGRVLVSGGGSSGTSVVGEVVSGSGTAWTLAHAPTNGVALFVNGQRLQLTTDYSIVTTAITTVLSWTAGTMLADYSY